MVGYPVMRACCSRVPGPAGAWRRPSVLSKAATAGGALLALERVECQRHESPPGVWGVGAGDVDDGGVGDQQKQQVLAGEVLAQLAGGLGAVDELHHLIVGLPAELLDGLTGRQRHAQQVRQATVTCLQFAYLLDKAAEVSPRIRDGQSLPGGLGVLGDLLDERGGDELLTVGEPAVQRGDADPGACGDLLQGTLRAPARRTRPVRRRGSRPGCARRPPAAAAVSPGSGAGFPG